MPLTWCCTIAECAGDMAGNVVPTVVLHAKGVHFLVASVEAAVKRERA